MVMLEGLTALRCVKSIVDMFQDIPAEGRMFSDSTAGISIALGTTGSWRTRHLRIRAQGLHEAIERGETTLEHQPGTALVADGMTKQLTGSPLKRFVEALKMAMETSEPIQVNSLQLDGGGSGGHHAQKLKDGIGLLIAASSLLLTPAEAAENITPGDEESGFWTILTVLVVGVLILGDLMTRFGLPRIRSWFCPKEELKVKLLSESAVLPTRGTVGSAGLDLSASEDYKINPGDYLLIKTGVAVELPRGTYGRLASRSSLASMGVEVSAGVIDRDFRGEIKVLMHNQSGREFWVRRGDRIAQLIVERVMEVEVQQVTSLSETSRGRQGFGSTGLEAWSSEELRSRAVRSLRMGSQMHFGGSSATNAMRSPTTTPRKSSMSHEMESCPRIPNQDPVPGEETSSTAISQVASSVTGPAANRCRNPERQGDGSACAGVPQNEKRIKAEDLVKRRPKTPPSIPAGRGPAIRCRNPLTQGDGSALAGEPEGGGSHESSATTGERCSATTLQGGKTKLMEGPPANLGLCPIGAPMPGAWFQESASFTERARVLKVQMKDIVPELQPDAVDGCPGLVKWDLLRPHQWIVKEDETLEELADRSGLAKFWPLHSDELWKLVKESLESPERDEWREVQINSATVMMVRLHNQPRRKIYDFKNETMSSAWNYGAMQLTIAKLMNGSFEIISGHRFGNGSPFLDVRWRGITCFIRTRRA
eukprot:s34_g9.t1